MKPPIIVFIRGSHVPFHVKSPLSMKYQSDWAVHLDFWPFSQSKHFRVLWTPCLPKSCFCGSDFALIAAIELHLDLYRHLWQLNFFITRWHCRKSSLVWKELDLFIDITKAFNSRWWKMSHSITSLIWNYVVGESMLLVHNCQWHPFHGNLHDLFSCMRLVYHY